MSSSSFWRSDDSCRVGGGFAQPTATPDGGLRKASTHPTRMVDFATPPKNRHVRDFCIAHLHFSRPAGTVIPMNSQTNLPVRVQLPRVLGPWMAVAMIIGTVI